MPSSSTRALVAASAACALLATACGSSGSDAGEPASSTAAVASTTTSSASSTPGTGGPGPGGSSTPTGATPTKAAIAYASESPTQTLDLYLPEDTGDGPVPVVVLIHGGAFKMGDASMEAAHAAALVDEGIAAASVNYRLSGEAPFPAGAQDVKAAVRWLRANADTYGLDPDRIGAWGESAGGWMANMLGATGDQATVFDDDALGTADQSDAVQAVVSWFGPSDFATMDEQAKDSKCPSPDVHGTAASPESVWLGEAVDTSSLTAKTDLTSYVAKADALPAWYLAHGDTDCQVPGGQSAEMAAALEAEGAEVTYEVLEGAGHGDAAFESTQLEPTVAFLVEQLGA